MHLLPALFLVLAICLIKNQIKRLNNREIIARETLIRVHTYSVIILIGLETVSHVLTYLAEKYETKNQKRKDYAKDCRY